MPRSTRIVHAAAALSFLLPAASAQAAGWTPAVPLPGTAATGAGAPQVAAAPAGAVTVAWTAGGRVYVSDRGADGSFGPARAVSAAGVSTNPVLAVGAGGRAVLAWVRDGLAEASVRPAAGAAFDTPALLSGMGAGELAATVGADGRVAVAWVRGSLVQVAERGAGQAAWPTTPHTFTENAPGFPAIAASPDGRLTVVWSAEIGIEPFQRSASKPAGGAWSAPVWGEATGLDTMDPGPVFAAADDTGAVTALWASRTGTGSDGYSPGHPVVKAGRSVAGGALSTGAVSDGPTTEAGAVPVPALAVAGSGDAAAIWLRQPKGEDVAVPEVALRAGSAGSWGSAAPLETAPLAQPFSTPDVALDPAGRPVAVWQRLDGTITGARAAGAWSTATAISGDGAEAPQVAVDAAGNGVAVWRRAGGLETATYDVTPPPPHEGHDGDEQPGGPQQPGPDKPGAPQQPAPGAGTTQPGPQPRATTASDTRSRVRLTALKLRPAPLRAGKAATLTFVSSGAANVTVRVQRRAGRTWRTTRTLTRRAAGRGTVTVRLPAKALRVPGTHRVTVTAGTITATKTFRVR